MAKQLVMAKQQQVMAKQQQVMGKQQQLGRLVSESAFEREDPGSNPAADMVDAARITAWDLGNRIIIETGECGEEDVALLYHQFIHSGAGAALLRLEHQYHREVALLVRRRHEAILKHDQKQATELTEAVSRSCSDSLVNSLSARHLEACELLHAEWESSISALKEQQLRNFRTVVRDGQVAGAAL
ncbi:Protein of unknown function DUF2362 [Trinorchestia longiramus]|nr:Protein of unknown function DUF2362 [Trinorchestia longiramus]